MRQRLTDITVCWFPASTTCSISHQYRPLPSRRSRHRPRPTSDEWWLRAPPSRLRPLSLGAKRSTSNRLKVCMTGDRWSYTRKWSVTVVTCWTLVDVRRPKRIRSVTSAAWRTYSIRTLTSLLVLRVSPSSLRVYSPFHLLTTSSYVTAEVLDLHLRLVLFTKTEQRTLSSTEFVHSAVFFRLYGFVQTFMNILHYRNVAGIVIETHTSVYCLNVAVNCNSENSRLTSYLKNLLQTLSCLLFY